MKTDLATSILAAVVGVVVAYLVCNLLLPGITPVSFSTLGTGSVYTLTSPDDEVFNYRALNPTVEVYVGECKQYNENNECIDDQYQSDSDDGIAEDNESVDGQNTESENNNGADSNSQDNNSGTGE